MAVLNCIQYFSLVYKSAIRTPVSVHKVSQISSVVRSCLTVHNYYSILCPGQAEFSTFSPNTLDTLGTNDT